MKIQNNVDYTLDTCEHFNAYIDSIECYDCVFARGGELGNEGAEGTCPYFEDVEE